MSYTTQKYLKSLVSDDTIEDLICCRNIESFFNRFNKIIVSDQIRTAEDYYDLYKHIYNTYNRDTLPFALDDFTIIFNHYQDILKQRQNMNINYDGAIL